MARQRSKPSERRTNSMAEETGLGTAAVRAKEARVRNIEDDGIDTVGVLLRAARPSLPEQEAEARERRFDHAEKTHRGMGWKLFKGSK
jgi:hypothetical protein